MSDALFYPVLMQVGLTLALAVATGLMRFRAIASGRVKPGDIALGQGAWPRRAQQVSNAYQNQMEAPVLFYAGALFATVLGVTSTALVVLAWVWAVSRLLHAFIHVTSNHLRLRFMAFAAGMLCLMAFWIVLVVEVVTQ